MDQAVTGGTGWVRDLPDPRDYTPSHERVRALLAPLKGTRARRARPSAVDWQECCPPVWDPQGLPAGAGPACAALAAYFERRCTGRAFNPSWLFLVKTSRILGKQTGNASPSWRQTLKAMARFGLPPSEYDPGVADQLDEPPPAFLYCFAREYGELVYLRLDPPGTAGGELLALVKGFLAAGFPVGFGSSLFDTLGQGPDVPFPSAYDAACGGAALLCVGYDDRLRIRSERGALRVRAPWGPAWGDAGHGWLPYRYLTDGLAGDFWAILRPDWLREGDLLLPC